MFSSKNLIAFGKELKQIRLSSNLTQAKVKMITGLNEDTIRRIENGLVVPKYETLELLSNVYKTDLLELLKRHRSYSELYSFYEYFDKLITSNKITSSPSDILVAFNEILKNESIYNFVNPNEINVFSTLITESHNFFDSNYKDYELSINRLNNTLKKSISNYNFETYCNQKYSHLETRVLLLISLFLAKNDNVKLSTKIMLFCLENFEDSKFISSEINKIIIKLNLNVSYNYHLLEEYRISKKYALEGIKHANAFDLSYCLPHLFARLAVSQFKLADDMYQDSFQKMMMLFEITGNQEQANLYRKITFEKYGITI